MEFTKIQMKKKAIIISIKGTTLIRDEKLLLSKEKPWGLILFTRNKKSARDNIRIFAHTYYSNDLGEPTSIKSSSQMHLDDAWDKWHDLQLEGWTFEELELPESA